MPVPLLVALFGVVVMLVLDDFVLAELIVVEGFVRPLVDVAVAMSELDVRRLTGDLDSGDEDTKDLPDATVEVGDGDNNKFLGGCFFGVDFFWTGVAGAAVATFIGQEGGFLAGGFFFMGGDLRLRAGSFPLAGDSVLAEFDLCEAGGTRMLMLPS